MLITYFAEQYGYYFDQELIEYTDDTDSNSEKSEKYSKYDIGNYEPTKHEYIE